MTDKSNCRHCVFWVSGMDQPRNGKTLEEGEGECRRRAPVGGGLTAYFAPAKTATRMIAVYFPWPIVHQADWCGEFVSLPTAPADAE